MPTTEENTAAPTVRLRNITTKMSISMDVPWTPLRAHPRMQRGLHLRPIYLGPGQELDLCKKFGCSYPEARNIANSKIVKAFKRAGHLAVLMDGEGKPKPVQAPLMPGKELRSVPDEELGVKTILVEQDEPTPPAVPEVAPEVADIPKAVPSSMDDLSSSSPSSFADLEEKSEDAPVDAESLGAHPTSEWTTARLKEYADMHDIDLEGARGKNAIIKKIRGSMSES